MKRSSWSRLFSNVVNTSRQGMPVPIAYGRVFVGSAVLSSGLDVDQNRHDTTKYIQGAGGGKGGGNSSGGTEADDTLQSIQFANVLDLVAKAKSKA